MEDMVWFNFRTGKNEYVTPTDYSDYVPQIGGVGMYQIFVAEGMSPARAALKVLSKVIEIIESDK